MCIFDSGIIKHHDMTLEQQEKLLEEECIDTTGTR